MSDHVLYKAADTELEYLIRCYDDGDMTVCTRPVNGHRWSPEVTMHEVVEATA